MIEVENLLFVDWPVVVNGAITKSLWRFDFLKTCFVKNHFFLGKKRINKKSKCIRDTYLFLL